MYQQLWGYKVEENLYLGVREQKRLKTTSLDYKLYRPEKLSKLDLHHSYSHPLIPETSLVCF
jgi:hypothetical protein